jgi:hypothetical protein
MKTFVLQLSERNDANLQITVIFKYHFFSFNLYSLSRKTEGFGPYDVLASYLAGWRGVVLNPIHLLVEKISKPYTPGSLESTL